MAVGYDELAHLSGIGIQLRRLDPSFDTRTYGFYSLTGLFKSLPKKYEIVYKNPGTPPLIKLKKYLYRDTIFVPQSTTIFIIDVYIHRLYTI